MFLINLITSLKDLIKILITYACILFCGCLKDKCIDNNDNEPVIGSPTPLKSNNSKHPILEAYERSIIAKLHPEAEASENKIINDINNNNKQ